MAKELIRLQNVSMQFDGETVLDNISLTINGEVGLHLEYVDLVACIGIEILLIARVYALYVSVDI